MSLHNISRWSHAKYFAGFYVLVLPHLRVRKSYFQIKSILSSKILQCIHFRNVLEMEVVVLGFSAVLMFRELYLLLAPFRCWSVGKRSLCEV